MVERYVELVTVKHTLVPLKPPVQILSRAKATMLCCQRFCYPIIPRVWTAPGVILMHGMKPGKRFVVRTGTTPVLHPVDPNYPHSSTVWSSPMRHNSTRQVVQNVIYDITK